MSALDGTPAGAGSGAALDAGRAMPGSSGGSVPSRSPRVVTFSGELLPHAEQDAVAGVGAMPPVPAPQPERGRAERERVSASVFRPVQDPAAAGPVRPDEEPDPLIDELLAEVVEVHAGRGDMDAVMRLFRQAPLWVETERSEHSGDQHALRAMRSHGSWWLPVFSSLRQFALFCRESGRADSRVRFGRVSGAEALEVCLPELPQGTGLLLDPVAEHVLTLPAVAGIVPDSLVVDRPVAAGNG